MAYPDIKQQKDEDGDEYGDYSIHVACSFLKRSNQNCDKDNIFL